MSVTVGACSDSPVSDIVEVSLLDKGQVVATAKGVQGTELRLAVQILRCGNLPILIYMI